MIKTTEFYKFFNENGIEWRWETNEKNEKDVIAFLYFFEIDDFIRMLPQGLFEEDGIPMKMKYYYFAIWMKDIVEYMGLLTCR